MTKRGRVKAKTLRDYRLERISELIKQLNEANKRRNYKEASRIIELIKFNRESVGKRAKNQNNRSTLRSDIEWQTM